MDFFTKYRRQISRYVTLLLLVQLALLAGLYWLADLFLNGPFLFGAALGAGFVITLVWSHLLTKLSVAPTHNLWRAIQHVAPNGGEQAAPDLANIRVGRELISTLANNVYQLASVAESTESHHTKQARDIHANFVANSLPLPLLVLDKDDTIVYVNEAAGKYLGFEASELTGQNVHSAMDMSFPDEQTLEAWLKTVKLHSVTANQQWERVRIGLPGQKDTKQFDLAAHYNKSNPMGYELMIVLFDHSDVYSQDDQAMSFVALTVHELRTPLTLLRGYIEVFDEELGPNLNAEMQGFMQKMDASAQQLTAFVDNILNVAKIEDDQLTLQLHEEKWDEVLSAILKDLNLRASVRGITIKTDIATDLPTVAVDRYSIYEVVSNLLDNAIKYSRGTKEIYLTTQLNSEGLIETSIKDFGLGIDASILPHVFDKFYRNHRNRAQIGGTGLGLYLSRAIVQAHSGNIWVRSKVDQGSTFSFTIQPFAKLAEMHKTGDTSGITRSAHGWIKNHSLYRD